MAILFCIFVMVVLIQFAFRNRPRSIKLSELEGYVIQDSFYAGDTIPVYMHASTRCEGRLYRLSCIAEDMGIIFSDHTQIQSNQFHPSRGLQWTDPILIQTTGFRPGYYYLHVSSASSAAHPAYIPFIIKSRHPHEIVIVASTNTWQAYNHFGGKSNYVDNRRGLLERLIELIFYIANYVTVGLIPSRPVVLPMARPFSWAYSELDGLSRPDKPSPFSHLIRSEWNLVAFLESRGYAYTVISDRDFQLNDGMSGARLIVFNTHSEYWTNEMLARLEAIQTQGGPHMVFASGNNAFRIAEYYDHGLIVTNQFSNIATVSRLVGTYYTKAGYLSFAPYRTELATHWIFENTGLSQGSLFGTQSTWTINGRPVGGASGYETDKIYPSGAPIIVLAVGTNPSGPAYLTIKETGTQFTLSMGSVAFAGALPVDTIVQQMFTNILHRAQCTVDRKRSTNHTPSAGGEKKGGVSQVGVVGCSMAC